MSQRSAPPAGTLWTIGHSTRPWEDFVQLLRDAGIQLVADVRRFAGSRRHPQFSGEAMARALPVSGIQYRALPDLGGRRSPRADSPNTAWRNAAFRGYADYMDTPAYQQSRQQLGEWARAAPTAVMCAEALWWQCHRSLIADDFKAHGWQVLHIQAPGRVAEHPYTGAARIIDGRLDYSLPPASQQELF